MEIEWSRVEKASSYEVTYNNLDTESVKTITGISSLKADLVDMEPASRYQIYVVSIQEKESFDDENGEVFTSYSGDPIHGLTQIDAPAEVCAQIFGNFLKTYISILEQIFQRNFLRNLFWRPFLISVENV